MRTNRLRELLNANQPSMGTRLQTQWPTMVEIIGHTKVFDYVEIVAEYAPYSLFSLENMGRAIDLFEHMSGMIKVEQESRQHLAVRAIGAGIQIVVAETEAEAWRIHAASPYKRRGRVVGTPDQVAAQLKVYMDLGVDIFFLRFDDFPSQTGIRLFAEAVIPQLTAAHALAAQQKA